MIKSYLKYVISEPEKGTVDAIEKYKSITLKYPCTSTSVCSPYEITLRPSVYRFECWGSKGNSYGGIPGLGGYTKGTLLITKPTKMYVYIGVCGTFNSGLYQPNIGPIGGGATDVRLNKSDNWYDTKSLISRIMVAAGGGGAEWGGSIGGNGGGLNGGDSIGVGLYDKPCKGASQTGSSSCPEISGRKAYPGSFGIAGSFESSDHGGLGGGGYYGGTSYDYTYAGSGGSSFISGYKGCDAVADSDEVNHTGTPFHYSGFVFYDSEMIPGNQTMPLPFSNDKGKWNSNSGAFRITLIKYAMMTCDRRAKNTQQFISMMIVLVARS